MRVRLSTDPSEEMNLQMGVDIQTCKKPTPTNASPPSMIFSATMGIGLLYLFSFVMSFFGSGIGFIHSNGLFGIGFSLFVVGIAALNLVLDFDFIEEGAEKGLPKHMEWYGAFSLMVTLVWLYIEILRLLMKLRSR